MECGFASIAKQKAVANGPTRLENIAEDEHGAPTQESSFCAVQWRLQPVSVSGRRKAVQMVFLFGILYLVFYVSVIV